MIFSVAEVDHMILTWKNIIAIGSNKEMRDVSICDLWCIDDQLFFS